MSGNPPTGAFDYLLPGPTAVGPVETFGEPGVPRTCLWCARAASAPFDARGRAITNPAVTRFPACTYHGGLREKLAQDASALIRTFRQRRKAGKAAAKAVRVARALARMPGVLEAARLATETEAALREAERVKAEASTVEWRAREAYEAAKLNYRLTIRKAGGRP